MVSQRRPVLYFSSVPFDSPDCTHLFLSSARGELFTLPQAGVADPDPSFHFDADLNFHFDADPTLNFDAHPDPAPLRSDANLRLMV
jgi:hypothetical protein